MTTRTPSIDYSPSDHSECLTCAAYHGNRARFQLEITTVALNHGFWGPWLYVDPLAISYTSTLKLAHGLGWGFFFHSYKGS